MPSVPSSVLNHAITCFEKSLSSVIQFEIHFTKNNDVEVHRVGRVHPRMIRFYASVLRVGFSPGGVAQT